MTALVYIATLFSVALSVVLVCFFLYLLLYKTHDIYVTKRNDLYCKQAMPKLVKAISNSNPNSTIQDFVGAGGWKRELNIQLLERLAIIIKSDKELYQLHRIISQMELDTEIKKRMQDKRTWIATEAIRRAGNIKGI